MDLACSPAHEQFREEVRAFLQQTRAQWPPSRDMGRATLVTGGWQALLIERSGATGGLALQEWGVPSDPLMEQGGGYR